MANLKLSVYASLACADFLHLEQQLRRLESAGVDGLHVDVMDGQFVPNFALSQDIIRTVRNATSLRIDAHLMVEHPERHIESIARAGAQIITVHQEATVHLHRALAAIHSLGASAGVALNPATPLQTLEWVLGDVDLVLVMTVNPGFTGQKLVPQTIQKIVEARKMIDQCGKAIEIQVDGNVSFEHAPQMVQAGATCLVGGTSSLFAPSVSFTEAVARLRAAQPKL